MSESPDELKDLPDDGDLGACFKYACLLDDGREVACDPTSAASDFQHVAENLPTHGAALVRYARCLRLGRGTDKDTRRALELLPRS
jgi:TPR repeat protein